MGNKHHYTYYSYEEWGRGYIGKRSCDCLPEEDVSYFGSFTDTTFKPTQKIIFRSDYKNAEELTKDEIILHDFYDVARNPHFANKVKQTSTGFDVTGVSFPHTEETKQRMSVSKLGEKNPNYGKTGTLSHNFGRIHTDSAKQKMSLSHAGKTHTDETKQKMSASQAGEKNHNYGKTATEETKQRMRESHTGQTHTEETKQKIREGKTGEKNPNFGRIGERSWYVNPAGKTRWSKEPPGPEWQQGRSWEPEQ